MRQPVRLDSARDVAFAAVNVAFASLGRICMALDGTFRVRHVSEQFDSLLGPGSARRVVGQPVETVLGPLFDGTCTGTISALNFPPSMATMAFRWLS